jgi:PAS domain-containing protein
MLRSYVRPYERSISTRHHYRKAAFTGGLRSEFTGLPQERGLGHGWLESIHPADAAAFRAQLPMAPGAFEDVQAELRVRRYDGTFHRHLLNVRHVGDGKLVGCAINAHELLPVLRTPS